MVCRRTVAMKKIANIMTMMMLSGVTLMTSSCQETKEERFEREAKEYTERKCPQKLDKEGVFVLDSMVFRNDGSRVMRNYYTIDTDSVGLRAFQDKKEEMRSLLLDAIINSADMRHVREEGLSIEYIYCDKNTGEEVGRFLFDSEDYGQD